MDKELLEALGKVLDEKLNPVKNELQKNSLLLENLNRKIEVIAEVQTAFKEQLERAKDKDGNTVADRLNIIELAVKDTSSRVKDVQKDLTRVVRATAENWAEIVELKAVK
jgi:hypothetical protein